MSLDRDIDYLRQVPLLSEFSDEQLRLFAFSAENITVDAGAELYHQGDRTEAGFVIVSGRISLEAQDENGRSELASFGPGSLLGEMALFVETTRPNSAIARERSEVIRIRRALFKRMLLEYPEIAQALQVKLGDRLRATTGRMAGVADKLEELSAIDATIPRPTSG